MARKGRGKKDDDRHQLQIDWPPEHVLLEKHADQSSSALLHAAPATELLVQRLSWDFKTSFPQPTDEAIDNGVLDESDRQPENLKSLHESYARQCLATLAELDKVTDARRQGVDPGTGRKPRTHVARERLRKYLAEEPARLEHSFDALIDTYAEGFGSEAADAFRKAITAWHAGIEVAVIQKVAPSRQVPAVGKGPIVRRSSALPVPKPLSSSVTSGVFGSDDDEKPIRPTADEVRAITEQRAERMIEMNENEFQAAVAKYADDFGTKAAAQLERYVRRQQHSR
jgi:hypothetical protein